MTTTIIIAIAAIVVVWFIGVQRKLVGKEELCKNAMSQIGVQMSSRWDALTALAELTKSYNEHEYNALKDIIAMRGSINSGSTTAQAQEQEDTMGKVLSRIIAVAESYPDLKANTNYLKTMDSVNMYENQVRMSRMVYNDSVTAFNRIIRQFPSAIVASLLHFIPRDYLAEDKSKSSMPSMKI